jgi:hypothetical protein
MKFIDMAILLCKIKLFEAVVCTFERLLGSNPPVPVFDARLGMRLHLAKNNIGACTCEAVWCVYRKSDSAISFYKLWQSLTARQSQDIQEIPYCSGLLSRCHVLSSGTTLGRARIAVIAT